MKVHVVVLPRRGILDPQGKTISEALQNTGFDSVSNVRAGKFFELEIDTDSTLPLSERYFLGGLGQFQLRGFKARSVGPRRPILRKIASPDLDGEGPLFAPVGWDPTIDNGPGVPTGGCEALVRGRWLPGR